MNIVLTTAAMTALFIGTAAAQKALQALPDHRALLDEFTRTAIGAAASPAPRCTIVRKVLRHRS